MTDKFRQYLEKRGTPISAFAVSMGMQPSTLTRYLNGERQIPIPMVKRIVDFLPPGTMTYWEFIVICEAAREAFKKAPPKVPRARKQSDSPPDKPKLAGML